MPEAPDLLLFPSLEIVEAQLARVLASSHFSGAGRLSAFLEFVVRKTVSGRSEEIKEYTVGTEVFGRPHSFDPRLDTIVRVQASKLRTRLAEYYADSGSNDPVVIELPRGTYVPSIHARTGREEMVEDARPRAGTVLTARSRMEAAIGRMRLIWVMLAFVAMVLIGTVFYRAAVRARPDGLNLQTGLAVLPFANLSGNAGDQYLSDGLTEEIIGALGRIDGLRVPGYVSSFAAKGNNWSIQEIGRQLRVAAVLVGSTRVFGSRLRVAARLVQVKDGEIIWSETYERPLRDVFDVEANISRSIVNAR
jgi:adenylate cyclase